MQKQWFTHTKYWRVILATKYKILESNFDNKIYSIQSEGICGLLTSETEASPIMRRHETNRAMSATDPESRKNASCLILNTVWIQNWTQGSRLSYKNKKRKDKRVLQISVATSKKIKKKKNGKNICGGARWKVLQMQVLQNPLGPSWRSCFPGT